MVTSRGHTDSNLQGIHQHKEKNPTASCKVVATGIATPSVRSFLVCVDVLCMMSDYVWTKAINAGTTCPPHDVRICALHLVRATLPHADSLKHCRVSWSMHDVIGSDGYRWQQSA